MTQQLTGYKVRTYTRSMTATAFQHMTLKDCLWLDMGRVWSSAPLSDPSLISSMFNGHFAVILINTQTHVMQQTLLIDFNSTQYNLCFLWDRQNF